VWLHYGCETQVGQVANMPYSVLMGGVFILEGKGKKRRYIKIRQVQDIQDKQVKYFAGNALNMQGK